MSHSDDMRTLQDRVASFDAVRPKGKERTSNVKSKKGEFTWSLTSPSIDHLAQAGFFYAPTLTSVDNVQCFNCNKAFDCWEEGDNGFEEHLAKVPGCSWAIVTAIEKGIIEANEEHDPLSEEFLEARKDTFGSSWPFEKKRGWTPKTQKLAEAGWHYFPAPESEDYTKCAYCNLCLDGWEPKDKPIDEHKKRSPDCPFFTLTDLHNKTRKSKKGRVSKVSRSSIQSTVTTQDDSALDLSAQPDDSILTTATDVTTASTTSTTAKKGRKSKKSTAKAGGRATRGKQVEEEPSVVEIEPPASTVDVGPAPQPKKTRGKKRSTAEMQNDAQEDDVAEPPRKRATRSRNSAVPSILDVDQSVTYDVSMADADLEELSMPKRGGKKRGAAGPRTTSRTISGTRKTSRKASATSSDPPPRRPVLDEGEIDAMLEADLERSDEDDEMHLAKAAINSKSQLEEMEEAQEAEEEAEAVPEAKTKPKRAPRGKIANRAASKGTASQVSEPSLGGTKDTQSQDILASGLSQVGKNKQAAPRASGRKATKAFLKDEVKESQDVLAAYPPRQPSPAVDDSVIITQPNQLFVNHYDNVDDEDADIEMALDEHEPEPARDKTKTKKTVQKAPAANVKKGKASKKDAQSIPKPEPEVVADSEDELQSSGKEDRSMQPETQELRFSSSFEHEPSILEEAEVPLELVEHFSPKKPIPTTKPTKTTKAVKSKATKPVKKTQTKVKATISKQKVVAVEKDLSVEIGPEAVEVAGRSPSPSAVRPAHIASHAVPKSPRQMAPGGFPSPTPSPQSSNAENEQPSARPAHTRPPLQALAPSQATFNSVQVPLAAEATTPTRSVRRDRANDSVTPEWALKSSFPWHPVDIEAVFLGSPDSKRSKWLGPAVQDKENMSPSKRSLKQTQGLLTSPEKKMTIEEWITSNSEKCEQKLKSECERRVGELESYGVRALRALEGLEVVDE